MQACVLIGSLELKFIVHAGTFVVQQLSTRTHVAGPAVILAHRLLKNRVTEETGLRGYALITDAALELLGLDPSEGVGHSETYADAGDDQRPRLRACALGEPDPGVGRAVGLGASGCAGSRGPPSWCPDPASGR